MKRSLKNSKCFSRNHRGFLLDKGQRRRYFTNRLVNLLLNNYKYLYNLLINIFAPIRALAAQQGL
jgi:hypothetical protein